MGAIKKTQSTLIGLIPLVVIVIIVAVAFRFFGGFDILTGIAKRAQGFTSDFKTSKDDFGFTSGEEEQRIKDLDVELKDQIVQQVDQNRDILLEEIKILQRGQGKTRRPIKKTFILGRTAKVRRAAEIKARGKAGRKLFEESKRKGNTVTINGKVYSTRFLSEKQIRASLEKRQQRQLGRPSFRITLPVIRKKTIKKRIVKRPPSQRVRGHIARIKAGRKIVEQRRKANRLAKANRARFIALARNKRRRR